MDRLTAMRIGVALVGAAVWMYGYAADNGGVRLAAIIILAVALVLRFLRRRPSGDGDATG
jgi:uncharacterized membrane protein